MTYYHASPARLADGELVSIGFPANFADEPMEHVFFSDNMTAAEYWADFLGNEEFAEILGYWRDVYIYAVEPTGSYEPDPENDYMGVEGCYQTASPLRVISLKATQKGQ